MCEIETTAENRVAKGDPAILIHRQGLHAKTQRQSLILGLALTTLTLALYWPATGYQFIVIDDDQYVGENPWITRGPSLACLEWALSTAYAANWHPLTWLSHALDYSLYGQFAGGHHLTNILLHALNTLLVFLLLKRWTHSALCSAVVAALFGWHPLHVESVAWVSERKDVLSTFFFLLTLIAYTRYAGGGRHETGDRRRETRDGSRQVGEDSQPKSTGSLRSEAGVWKFYVVALALFALGLMSKPMVVTLPFVLLLLDYWPLRRLELSITNFQFSAVRYLFLEKLPFFALSLGGCAVTLVAQHGGGAVRSVEEVSGLMRVFNALAAYGTYLSKTLCPANLCVLYPLTSKAPIGTAALSLLTIAGLSWLALRLRAKYPWLVVGWLWFLGTLVPVIGLVQVGNQAAADRYTYIPLIGVFLAAVLTIDVVFRSWPPGRALAIGGAVIALAFCAMLSRAQLGYWHDSISLCTRACLVTENNSFAENLLGVALANAGRQAEAIEHYKQALRLNPDSAPAHYNLGLELAAAGELDQAGSHFSQALKTNPSSEKVHNNLGVILARQQKFESATEQFEKAIGLNPQYPKPYLNYAMVLQKLGRTGEALTNYSKALQLDADWPDALNKLAFLLANCPDERWRNPGGAILLAERANKISHWEVPEYLASLAEIYATAGQHSNAVFTAEQARKEALRQGLGDSVQNLEEDLQTYKAGAYPRRNWKDAATWGTQR